MASYIERSLGDGERIIARARFPWTYGLRAWLRLLLPLMLLLYILGERESDPASPLAQPWLVIVVGAMTAVGFVLFLLMIVYRATTEIGVTSHRFVEKVGVVSLRTNEIALHNIEGVRVNQGVAGRVLNYGTVRIEGTGVDAVTTPPIADPVAFVKAIQTAREQEAGR
ncbi:MAG: PH domain-containing protein [Alphaproteobacteria bacterium]|nr:PH domain-containing protein [Alphaproteobacteria bacterium]